MTRALASVRVLDAATLYPAPLLAAMLGDLGADVVKVEPRQGDPLRMMGDAPFTVANRSKRSVCADLDSNDGIELLGRLTAVTDVVVFNQPASVLAQWACTDDAISARNERAVIVHVSAFGSTGPYSGRVGNGSLAEAFIGLDPVRVPLGDTMGAQSAALAVLAALYERDTTTGRGCVLDVSLYEALLPLLAPALAGSRALASVRDTMPAADARQVMVAATTQPQIDRLGALTGASGLHSWVGARTAAEAVAELVAARVPAVVVNDIAGLRSDPHVIARGGLPVPGSAPALGEHTTAVVEEWLGGSG